MALVFDCVWPVGYSYIMNYEITSTVNFIRQAERILGELEA